MNKIKCIALLITASLLTGCYSNANSVLDAKQSQVKLRSFQSRSFDTNDKTRTLRTVIATLQDLEFVIDKADASIGSITGTKFINNQPLLITVTIREHNESQTMVRANAQYGIKPIDTPEPYQDFFNALAKSMFLDAHEST